MFFLGLIFTSIVSLAEYRQPCLDLEFVKMLSNFYSDMSLSYSKHIKSVYVSQYSVIQNNYEAGKISKSQYQEQMTLLDQAYLEIKSKFFKEAVPFIDFCSGKYKNLYDSELKEIKLKCNEIDKKIKLVKPKEATAIFKELETIKEESIKLENLIESDLKIYTPKCSRFSVAIPIKEAKGWYKKATMEKWCYGAVEIFKKLDKHTESCR